jgi:hypothetical protein
MNRRENRAAESMSRRSVVSAASAAVALLPLAAANSAAADTAKPSFMFVQTADNLKADPAASTIRLVNVGKQTVYFSDRPVRLAGHLLLDDYLKEWTKAEGSDNFGKSPPNASISVFEPGQTDSTIAVVELTKPRKDGDDLVYSYKLLEGKMPSAGGATTLFIDAIGIGGGVGFGFHGVGVGRRGIGWR